MYDQIILIVSHMNISRRRLRKLIYQHCKTNKMVRDDIYHNLIFILNGFINMRGKIPGKLHSHLLKKMSSRKTHAPFLVILDEMGYYFQIGSSYQSNFIHPQSNHSISE